MIIVVPEENKGWIKFDAAPRVRRRILVELSMILNLDVQDGLPSLSDYNERGDPVNIPAEYFPFIAQMVDSCENPDLVYV